MTKKEQQLQKRREYAREYYRLNKQKCIANNLRWQTENPEAFQEAQQRYYQRNRDKLCKAARDWAKKNRLRFNKRMRKYYAENREKMKAQRREWARKRNALRIGDVIKIRAVHYRVCELKRVDDQTAEYVVLHNLSLAADNTINQTLNQTNPNE